MQKSNRSWNDVVLSHLLILVTLTMFTTEVVSAPAANPEFNDGNAMPNDINIYPSLALPLCTSGFNIPSTSSTSGPEDNQADAAQAQPIAYEITLFTGSEKSGVGHHLTFQNGDGCEVLPPYMQNRVNSVDTHGTCVALCEDKNCKSCVKFHPGSRSHDRLKRIDFHNKAKSAIPCTF